MLDWLLGRQPQPPQGNTDTELLPQLYTSSKSEKVLTTRPSSGEPTVLSIRELIQASCPSILTGFKPSWWLRNGHAQTIYCVAGDFTKIDNVNYHRKYITVADGGTLGVDFTSLDGPENSPIIVVQHGLTGGSYEAYVRHILAVATLPKDQGGLGYRGAVINFRGCAGVPITSPRFYSAAATDDLASGALYISKKFPNAKLIGLGFSLGSNNLTRYLGEEGEHSRLSAGCALACPWNLAKNSEHLEGRWFHRAAYSKTMGSNLVKLFTIHSDSLHNLAEMSKENVKELIPAVFALRKPALVDVDEVVVSKLGGRSPPWPFPSAKDYYEYARSDKVIPGIRVPFLAINSEDDPIVQDIPKDVGDNPYVAILTTKYGGHLGWFEDSATEPKITRWIKKPVLEWLRAALEDIEEVHRSPYETELVDGFTREVGRAYVGFKETDEASLPKASGPTSSLLVAGL